MRNNNADKMIVLIMQTSLKFIQNEVIYFEYYGGFSPFEATT
jgi:hypothetical protein